MVQLFSFGFASLNRTFHLSTHENICTIALITIHYLYTIWHPIFGRDRYGRLYIIWHSEATGPGFTILRKRYTLHRAPH